MRIEAGGAQITETVADVLETLQTQPEIITSYLETLDKLTRNVIMNIDAADEENDRETLDTLRVLQMIRRDINALANPPEINLPENDIATVSI